MQVPFQVTFRNMDRSRAVEAEVAERVARLERFSDRITSCDVVVEAPHRQHKKGKHYLVRVRLVLPGREIVVGRDPKDKQGRADIRIAVRDAFAAAQRRLQDHVRRRRGDVKAHERPPHGRVVRLFPEDGYGFIESADGREIYFHRNSVVNEGFPDIEVGTEVRFVEAAGEKGPQASTVVPAGKHHVVG
jgi:cold shock CspA family protein/ribosome-associated translation inhibitor RaiA